MKLSSLLIFCMFLFMSSCRRGNITPTLPISADLLAHFSFKPGSYWIYKDSISGMEDSFFVWQNNYIHSTTSSPDGNDVFLRAYKSHDTLSMIYSLYIDVIDFEFYGGYVPLLEYPFQLGPLYRSFPDGTNPYNIGPSDSSAIINIFSSITINGEVYDSVAEVFHTRHEGGSGYPDTFYDTIFVSANKGVVKMIYHHPQDTINPQNMSWSVVRCNVIL